MNSQNDIAVFWDLYFKNLFVRLERSAAGYHGSAYAVPNSAAPPAGFFRKRELQQVTISMNRLREYDYDADGRFFLILQRPQTMTAAIDAVIARTYPYRDPAPFGKERMAELCAGLRSRLLKSAGESAISLTIAQQMLKTMINEHQPVLDQPIAALVWLLGEYRDRSSAPVLLDVLRNSSYAPFARHRLHFTAVDAAFSALWKVNEKTLLWEVLDLMRESSESGRRKMAALFERLISTKESQSLDLYGDRYIDADFWSTLLEPFQTYAPLDWDRRDVNSLFWEIRLQAAVRLPVQEAHLLQRLADDEVGTIRETVSQRLGSRI